MGCRDAFTWLSAIAPLAGSLRPDHSSFRPTTITCCIKGAPDSTSSSPSSSSSFSRRWYRSLRRRPFYQPPLEPVRHWVKADPPVPHAGELKCYCEYSLILVFCPLELPSVNMERFTVVSYNILGDKNASKHRDLYQNVPSIYMKWGHRKKIICDELIGWDPDIICLQEVDRYFDLLTVMEKQGYAGTYKRRTGDSVDGCAMFWKAAEFQLLDGESIEFKQHGLRDNVAQLCVFETHKAESRRLLIGNIHVLYNPSKGDVKLGQIRFLSSRANVLSEKWGNVPVVLAGDYNSTPQSAIYEFLSSSKLNITLHDRTELSGQRNCHPSQVFGAKREIGNPLAFVDRFFGCSWSNEEVAAATGSPECHMTVHPLKLSSSYAKVKGLTNTRGSNGEPLATSYHLKFLGTVDYLWYSDDITPTRVLDTLPIDVLWKTGGLPCKKLGSDHLALVSEFAFK